MILARNDPASTGLAPMERTISKLPLFDRKQHSLSAGLVPGEAPIE